MMKNNWLILGFCACFELAACNESKAAESKGVVSKAGSRPLHLFVDQWSQSGGLASFKAQMLHDLETGNQARILTSFSDILEFNSGTANGPAGVVEIWGLDGGRKKLAPLKAVLDSLLSNGGCFVPGGKDSVFTAPSYNCLSQKEKISCQESGCGIVNDGGAQLRQAPDLQANVQEELPGNEIIVSYADTLCDTQFSNCTWRKVTRLNGQKGFLPYSSLHTKSDGYIRIVKEKLGWKIRVLKSPGILTDDT